MTPQEALDLYLKAKVKSQVFFEDMDVTIISALEKQMPKGKWEHRRKSSFMFNCPHCGEVAYSTYGKRHDIICKYKYCPNCGQAIEGNDENDKL